jgi:2,4-dienoyl-CoA reductase-like NADH-dependent reductase (Old Yellow Enzyme family)
LLDMIDRPFTLPCGLTLPNRLAKAPMTEALADEDGHPSEALQRLFRRYGQGGAGLLITGNVVVDALHPVRPGDVVAVRGAPLAPWQVWAQAGREAGARFFVQVNHAGRQTARFVNGRPLSASHVPGRALGAFARPRAATEAEILELIGR